MEHKKRRKGDESKENKDRKKERVVDPISNNGAREKDEAIEKIWGGEGRRKVRIKVGERSREEIDRWLKPRRIGG